MLFVRVDRKHSLEYGSLIEEQIRVGGGIA